MYTKDEIIQAAENALVDVEIKMVQNRFSDAKSALIIAKQAVSIIKAQFPNENTSEFEAKITEFAKQGEAKEEQVSETTREMQLEAYHWREKEKNYGRNRLLGVKQITEFKQKEKKAPMSWVLKGLQTQPLDTTTKQALTREQGMGLKK
jgi:hypothetical protein